MDRSISVHEYTDIFLKTYSQGINSCRTPHFISDFMCRMCIMAMTRRRHYRVSMTVDYLPWQWIYTSGCSSQGFSWTPIYRYLNRSTLASTRLCHNHIIIMTVDIKPQSIRHQRTWQVNVREGAGLFIGFWAGLEGDRCFWPFLVSTKQVHTSHERRKILIYKKTT